MEQVREWNRDASVNTCTWPWLGASGGLLRGGLDRQRRPRRALPLGLRLTDPGDPSCHPTIHTYSTVLRYLPLQATPAPRPYGGGALGEWAWWVSVCCT